MCNSRCRMSNALPLMRLLFPATRQRALALLLLQPADSFHLRDLARRSATNAGTLKRDLDKLASAGLLTRTVQGNQVRYGADTGCPLFPELAGLFRKTHGTVPLLREALQPLRSQLRIAAVFGSVARGTEGPGSDVDLLAIGDSGFPALVRALHPVEQALGRQINPVLYAPAEFAARVQADEGFVRALVEQPKLFVLGGPDDVDQLAGDRATAAPPPRRGRDTAPAAGRAPQPRGRAGRPRQR
jgi:predicted nucleotidyltransferase